MQRDSDVEIRVRDTGKGIPRQDLERVFDLFTQLSPDTNGAQTREAGIDHHLAKPVDQAALHTLLAKMAVKRTIGR